MKDTTKDLVAKFYQDFDEMSREDLVVHLIEFEQREEDLNDEDLETLRECAWTQYAGHLGLEYFQGALMQFGDGGYPYLYIAPADGGGPLCHTCATKELKKGGSVGWMHHMEGEVEHCGCGAEIVPFNSDASYVEYAVTLKLRVRSDGATPDGWDWADLLDLAPGESCDIEVIGEEGLLSSQKITGDPDPDDDPVQRWGEMPLKE